MIFLNIVYNTVTYQFIRILCPIFFIYKNRKFMFLKTYIFILHSSKYKDKKNNFITADSLNISYLYTCILFNIEFKKHILNLFERLSKRMYFDLFISILRTMLLKYLNNNTGFNFTNVIVKRKLSQKVH
ncbi:hypothetical protein EDEG_01393 [Edhazardia aedis USNM 41457]|uniref:Uncharacterized protein n=1 Tax=Edhazardia aedis (strain USNM 41457) TaxID=1003232 RepID=J9DA16_EDHAE|nr:hypothetical protein EDEG_01393 [Edhazardia aedis USNM 41457]|eukprot:EJW04359.1 hypothetical protein EDEG_01393 [Edhazardia aedis USNM 41457]